MSIIVTPTETIRGDRATYSTCRCHGGGDRRRHPDARARTSLTGSRLSYNVDTGQARIEGGGQGGRVRGVFYPEGSN
jgi:lipopolysaccharide export system protein LptA